MLDMMRARPLRYPTMSRQHCLAVASFTAGLPSAATGGMQIVYLIELARHFKALPEQRRVDALAEPLIFRDEVDAVPIGPSRATAVTAVSGVPAISICRSSALRIARPIRDGLAADYLGRPVGDVDDGPPRTSMKPIMEAEARHGRLLCQAVAGTWQKPATSSEPKPTDEVRHAWKVHGSNVKGQDMVPIWRNKAVGVTGGEPAASGRAPTSPEMNSKASSRRTTDRRAMPHARRSSTSSMRSWSGCTRATSSSRSARVTSTSAPSPATLSS